MDWTGICICMHKFSADFSEVWGQNALLDGLFLHRVKYLID